MENMENDLYKKWNPNLINEQIGSCQDEEDLFSLSGCKNNSFYLFGDRENFIQSMEEDRYYMMRFDEFIKMTKRFSYLDDNLKWNGLFPYGKHGDIRMLALDFVNNFYQTKDPLWAKLFNKVYQERKNNLTFSGEYSFSTYLKTFDYSYINIGSANECFNKVNTLFLLVHEYMHAITNMIDYKSIIKDVYFFDELPSLTMELIATFEIIKNYDFLKEDAIAYTYNQFALIIEYAKNIRLEHEYFNKFSEDFNRRTTIKEFRRLHSLSYTDACSVFDNTIKDELTYTPAFIIAIELACEYFTDRDKFYYNMNTIINNKGCEEYLPYFKSLGLTPNKNARQVLNEIQKRVS